MIDYIKILLLNIDVDRLLKLLPFKFEVIESTGEYSTKRIVEFHFCKITINESGIILFTGSIHKLYNSLNGIKALNYTNDKIYKGFNGNQFTLINILEVREHLQNLFDCKPQQMIFQNIELGVNTTPGFNPNLYLKGLLYHRNKLFEFSFNDNLAKAKHQRFTFKIYNKSNQYGMSYFVIRIELQIKKIEELKGNKELESIGLKTFADVNAKTLDKAKEMLLKRFDEVMHFDYTINKKALTKKENQLIKSYSNPRYWIIDLKPNYRFRHKEKLQQITVRSSKKLHQQLRQNIITKCSIINRQYENPFCSIINRSSIELNMLQTPYKKKVNKCSITGLDLNHEKEGSKYIKTSTLNYLHTNDTKAFFEICSFLLSNSTFNRPRFENDIISHLRKQVRNRFYNPMTIKKTGYNQKKFSNQIDLFSNL